MSELALRSRSEQVSTTEDATIEDVETDGDTGVTATVFDRVWKPTSVRLELSSFGFHTGSLGYDITRELMSAQQLRELRPAGEKP